LERKGKKKKKVKVDFGRAGRKGKKPVGEEEAPFALQRQGDAGS
jgi:hypothetical protein